MCHHTLSPTCEQLKLKLIMRITPELSIKPNKDLVSNTDVNNNFRDQLQYLMRLKSKGKFQLVHEMSETIEKGVSSQRPDSGTTAQVLNHCCMCDVRVRCITLHEKKHQDGDFTQFHT